MDDGYNITLTEAPNDLGGRLRLNCARTTPELPVPTRLSMPDLVDLRIHLDVPCGLVILPHITLILDPRTSLCARYTNATFLPR